MKFQKSSSTWTHSPCALGIKEIEMEDLIWAVPRRTLEDVNVELIFLIRQREKLLGPQY